MLLVIGLGNPGADYALNRHNVGFRVAAAYREAAGIERFRRAGGAEVARGRRRGRNVVVARPQSFMNRSGEVVAGLLRSERAGLDELLVVVDDVYLPLGRLRVRRQGGDGGHNGLRSILDALGDQGFARLRFGVGAPPDGRLLEDWVLEDFGPEEEAAVSEGVEKAVEVIDAVLARGVEAAMNRFNAPAGAESAADGREKGGQG